MLFAIVLQAGIFLNGNVIASGIYPYYNEVSWKDVPASALGTPILYPGAELLVKDSNGTFILHQQFFGPTFEDEAGSWTYQVYYPFGYKEAKIIAFITYLDPSGEWVVETNESPVFNIR